jgi:hypothetical protein
MQRATGKRTEGSLHFNLADSLPPVEDWGFLLLERTRSRC